LSENLFAIFSLSSIQQPRLQADTTAGGTGAAG